MEKIKRIAVITGFAVLILVIIYAFIRPEKIIESEKIKIMTFKNDKELKELKAEYDRVANENHALKTEKLFESLKKNDIKSDEQIERFYGPHGELLREIISKKTIDKSSTESKGTSTTTSTATASESEKRNETEKAEKTSTENTISISNTKKETINSSIWVGALAVARIDTAGVQFDLKQSGLFTGADLFPGVVVNVVALPAAGYYGIGPGLKF